MFSKDSVVDCWGTTQKPASTPMRFFLAVWACCSGSADDLIQVGSGLGALLRVV